MAKKKVSVKKEQGPEAPVKVLLYMEDHGIKRRFTEDDAKKLLGWEEEPDGADWQQYDIKFNKKKVRWNNNRKNRPYRPALAKRWASEMGRKKWMFNGEPITIDTENMIVSGQHRCMGLILAEDDRIYNQAYPEWDGCPIEIDMLVVKGVPPEAADTTDLGQTRSLGDVLFRRREFKEVTERDQKMYSNVLAHAARLCWIRMGGKKISDAPHFPHSEALDWLELNPELIDSVEHVVLEDGGGGADGRKIRSYVSLGYAAGLHYLMSTALSNPETGEVDHSLKDKANEFWTLLATGAGLETDNPILHVRNLIQKMEAGSGQERDVIVATIVNGWNLWVDGKKGNVKSVRPKMRNDAELGRRVLAEYPRIGGLDVEIEWEEEDE